MFWSLWKQMLDDNVENNIKIQINDDNEKVTNLNIIA